MGTDNTDPKKRDTPSASAATTMSPEELAILKHRLATIDDAITGEELFKRVKEEVKKRASER